MDRAGQWDIFCKVIDNFGDIGVCWRLATQLAARGHCIRLWVDDSSALQWMAPNGFAGVQVLPWRTPFELPAADLDTHPCDVLIEAFGCEVAPDFIAACARLYCANGHKPTWINLEYLSAEAYVERTHRLPSPITDGPAAGWVKWFFYPGFTPQTGGLLHEPELAGRQNAFDAAHWLQTQVDIAGNVGLHDAGNAVRVSLFCYEPPLLQPLLQSWRHHGLNGESVHLFVTAGRATAAVRAIEAGFTKEKSQLRNKDGRELLSISYLPWLTQVAFDQLLWACDLNFVRGEDSLVRAIWAGKPFVWQAYPQPDGAHLAKLHALMDMLDAPASLRQFHVDWNSAGPATPDALRPLVALPWRSWQPCISATGARLREHIDLVSQLAAFVMLKKQSAALVPP